MNTQYTKEEFEQKLRESNISSYSSFQKTQAFFSEWQKKQIHRYAHITNAEHCSGDQIAHSKNCSDCYRADSAQDCKYGYHVWRESKDNMDVDTVGRNAELNYECINTVIDVFHNIGSIRCWTVCETYYSNECDYSKNIFGCIGLRYAQYCILNKQYTKEEYEELVPKIIEHMQSAAGGGEWGEFFPASISPFGYNETVAQEYFPLTKDQVLAKGWKWHEEEEKGKEYLGPKVEIPDNIQDVDDSLCEKILLCEVTGKPYKIIPQELKFYRNMGLPLPRKCPDQRHKERMGLRNPRKLWKRNCAKCSKEMKTTYAPERPEIVYCEECYLEELY